MVIFLFEVEVPDDDWNHLYLVAKCSLLMGYLEIMVITLVLGCDSKQTSKEKQVCMLVGEDFSFIGGFIVFFRWDFVSVFICSLFDLW